MKAYTPIYFKNISDEHNQIQNYKRLFYIIIILFTILSIIILSFLYTYILPESYKPGRILIPIISLAYLLRAFRQMFVPFIMKAEKTIFIALELFITIFVGTLSTMFLVKCFGLTGAAIALVVMQSSSLLYYYIIKKKIIAKII
jgi:O-antigen/teichoic acid export membrane protein